MGYILYEAIKGIRGHKLGKSKLSVLCSKVQGFPREKKKKKQMHPLSLPTNYQFIIIFPSL